MGNRTKSAEQFEHEYAERSGITVEELRRYGRVVLPCDCDEELCEGWVSISREHAEDHRRFYSHRVQPLE